MRVTKPNLFASTLLIWAWEMTQKQTETTTAALQTEALEKQKVDERSRELQRNLRSVGRAVRLMLFLTGLAIVGLGIATVLMPFWPQTLQQYLMMWPIKAHCALGLASLSCAFVYSGLGLFYHMELSSLRVKSGELTHGITRSRDAGLLLPVAVGNM